MRKYVGFAFAIALLVGLGMASLAPAAVNSWSGQNERCVPFSGALTTLTVIGTVCTASTGVAHNVRAITMTNTASGYVRLYSDSVSGANLIGSWSVIANTPLNLTEENLGPGVVTGIGKALVVDATTGTVSIQARVRADKTSPRGSN